MKIDCTCDGTLKGLCRDFFVEMDRLLDTDYVQASSNNRYTLDTLLLMMVQAARTHCLGLLVIDEIQHLSVSRRGGAEKMLNFFVTLVNKIGLPVVLIGTPKALPILQGDFRQARRGSGQGDILWEMMPESESWKVFLKAMWTYQYTREAVGLTDELMDALYYETRGLAFLAVILYKLVQEDAIIMGREVFGVTDVHRVAEESLGLTRPMRDALRTGKELDLQKFTDIHPVHYRQFLDNYSVEKEKERPVKAADDKAGSFEKATLTLMGMGIPYQEASLLVLRAQEKLGDRTKADRLAREAYGEYLKGRESENDDEGDLRKCNGYEKLLRDGAIDTEGF